MILITDEVHVHRERPDGTLEHVHSEVRRFGAPQLPPEVEEIRAALPSCPPDADRGLTADQIAFAVDRPIELVREVLWALRDQGLARLDTTEAGLARWSLA